MFVIDLGLLEYFHEIFVREEEQDRVCERLDVADYIHGLDEAKGEHLRLRLVLDTNAIGSDGEICLVEACAQSHLALL